MDQGVGVCPFRRERISPDARLCKVIVNTGLGRSIKKGNTGVKQIAVLNREGERAAS